ncbi:MULTISPECIES: hypothetical protein [Vagococcus]|uniref:Phage protein n=1 Tax=Vagococcus fluvialis bH819 TaxID=1255619 RepID=A0A1X6WNW2_9ENTE|nr:MULTISPECIES: hypothetical protein [Vagococcus]SLM86021.1 hypothetical protein FM121_08035 [Vagococcus fluvialis bH819]HCM88848.1 hypothetical protein [Vagococcus sp.]
MKKMMIVSLTALSILGIGAATTAYAMNNTATKEEMSYLKKINPNINEEAATSLKEKRTELDQLHQELTDLSIKYGIIVDNEKDGNKEAIHVDDLDSAKRSTYNKLSKNVWEKEIQFLDAQYEAGLIKKADYLETKAGWLKELNK